MAKIVELILTENRVGRGTEEDPVRINLELWTKEGQIVADHDFTKNTVAYCNLEVLRNA